MPTSPAPVAPFTVAEVMVTAMEALLSAAALHLGDALPDGRQLPAERRDPMEAWLALVGVAAWLEQLGPMMAEQIRGGYNERTEALLARLASRYPDASFPIAVPTGP